MTEKEEYPAPFADSDTPVTEDEKKEPPEPEIEVDGAETEIHDMEEE